MIAFFELDLNEIDRSARDYVWPRPEACPDCGHRKVWLHDFVKMIFNGFDRPLQMRRYRCPACGCVIKKGALPWTKNKKKRSPSSVLV
jgi:phage terminase large subunit GpA-like protein